jgi:hypothetical protein
MSILVDINPDCGFLKVYATGEFSLKEAKRTFLEVLDAVALHKSKKVLLDGREIKGKPETIERFYYSDFAAQAVIDYRERGVSPVTQFAYVLRKPVLDPDRFGETVAVNRGMKAKAFENLEEAHQWLGVSPARRLDADDGN